MDSYSTVGLVLLAWPLASLLPRNDLPPPKIEFRTFAMAVAIPAALTPFFLTLVDTHFLPVLVADYLALHMLVYGLLAIRILTWRGVKIGHVEWTSGFALAAYGILVFGGASLGVAVTLDFKRLFFLLVIIPVIVVFFAIFGVMGGWVGRRTLSPAAVGIGLGLILAWSLGVSFPMFRPN